MSALIASRTMPMSSHISSVMGVTRPARKLTNEDVLEVVKEAVRQHGAPDYLGSEFIAGIVQDWFRKYSIYTIYITPASPWENGWIESFHARLRDECLNPGLLLNLREARVVLEDCPSSIRCILVS
jgi:putative transposase